MKKPLNLYQQIAHNRRMSALLLFVYALFAGVIALAITIYMEQPLEAGIVVILIIVGLMYVQYKSASKMILGITGARPASREEYPFIYHTVEGLAIAAGIPAPKCYIIHSAAANAFATGKNPQEGVIALTTGLVEKLNNEEIEGVIAHEIAHIQNYDIRLATLTIAFVGVIVLISEILSRSLWYGGASRRRSRRDKSGGGGPLIILAIIFIILAPVFAKLLHLILSRRREFMADTSGAWLTRNPGGLASALRKISADATPLQQATSSTAPLYFVNPLTNRTKANSWFATHPPIAERIEILERLAYK